MEGVLSQARTQVNEEEDSSFQTKISQNKESRVTRNEKNTRDDKNLSQSMQRKTRKES